MKGLKDFDVQSKRVLVRCDFNVPLDENGVITDDFRIRQSLPTIRYLVENKAKVIIISHLGDPPLPFSPLPSLSPFSLRPVSAKLSDLLGQLVLFADDCVGEKAKAAVDKMQSGDIVLLENLRFHQGEKGNDPAFAAQLAVLGDIYVNDGFSVCHRAHASVAALAGLLPSLSGFLLQSELEVLVKLLEKPARPLVVIIGGVKASSKVAVLKRFLDMADYVLLNNKITDSLKEEAPEVDRENPRLRLAIDGTLDIGPKTTVIFSDIIRGAKTVFWAGPLGYVEDENFAKGSLLVAEAIIESGAFSVAGGGDTVAFLQKHNLTDKFSYVSTGGGALLEFLSGKNLPGLKALNYSNWPE